MKIYRKICELVEKDQEVRKKPSILAIHPEDYAELHQELYEYLTYWKCKGPPIQVHGLDILVNESVPVGGFFVGELNKGYG